MRLRLEILRKFLGLETFLKILPLRESLVGELSKAVTFTMYRSHFLMLSKYQAKNLGEFFFTR